MPRRTPEQATETVTLKASPEVLAQLLDRWSEPVQVRVTRVNHGTGWDLEIRAASR